MAQVHTFISQRSQFEWKKNSAGKQTKSGTFHLRTKPERGPSWKGRWTLLFGKQTELRPFQPVQWVTILHISGSTSTARGSTTSQMRETGLRKKEMQVTISSVHRTSFPGASFWCTLLSHDSRYTQNGSLLKEGTLRKHTHTQLTATFCPHSQQSRQGQFSPSLIESLHSAASGRVCDRFFSWESRTGWLSILDLMFKQIFFLQCRGSSLHINWPFSKVVGLPI